MKLEHNPTIVGILLVATTLASYAFGSSEAESLPATGDAQGSPAIDAPLPQLTVCDVADPKDPGGAFAIERGTGEDLAAQWVDHACKRPCRPSGAPTQHDQWQQCTTEAFDRRGESLASARGGPKRQLAFVVDGMGGHLAFTSDGDKTVFFQHGGGGAMHPQESANLLEEVSTARTVMMRWAPGYQDFFFPLGWFTRNSPEPADVRQQSRRIAAVLLWVHDHLSQGQAFGTVADSMGSVATFGAVVWHNLDSIIGAADDPHPPFKSSSMRYTGVDWEIDHPVDFMIDLGREAGPRSRGGDEHWALGQFTFVYNQIIAGGRGRSGTVAPPGHPTTWSVSHGTDHSQAMRSDQAVAAIKKGLDL